MSEYLFLRPTLIDPRSYLWFSYDDTSHNVLASGTVYSLEELKDVGGNSPERPVVILYPSSALKFKTVNIRESLRSMPMSRCSISLRTNLPRTLTTLKLT